MNGLSWMKKQFLASQVQPHSPTTFGSTSPNSAFMHIGCLQVLQCSITLADSLPASMSSISPFRIFIQRFFDSSSHTGHPSVLVPSLIPCSLIVRASKAFSLRVDEKFILLNSSIRPAQATHLQNL